MELDWCSFSKKLPIVFIKLLELSKLRWGHLGLQRFVHGTCAEMQLCSIDTLKTNCNAILFVNRWFCAELSFHFCRVKNMCALERGARMLLKLERVWLKQHMGGIRIRLTPGPELTKVERSFDF